MKQFFATDGWNHRGCDNRPVIDGDFARDLWAGKSINGNLASHPIEASPNSPPSAKFGYFLLTKTEVESCWWRGQAGRVRSRGARAVLFCWAYVGLWITGHFCLSRRILLIPIYSWSGQRKHRSEYDFRKECTPEACFASGKGVLKPPPYIHSSILLVALLGNITQTQDQRNS
jgi:hypothetical protein